MSAEWYADRGNLALLARHMGEQGDSVDDVAYMLEKPYKYEDEWQRAKPDQPAPGVKPRSVKVHDDLWNAAKERAADKGETVTDVIRRALVRYTR